MFLRISLKKHISYKKQYDCSLHSELKNYYYVLKDMFKILFKKLETELFQKVFIDTRQTEGIILFIYNTGITIARQGHEHDNTLVNIPQS